MMAQHMIFPEEYTEMDAKELAYHGGSADEVYCGSLQTAQGVFGLCMSVYAYRNRPVPTMTQQQKEAQEQLDLQQEMDRMVCPNYRSTSQERQQWKATVKQGSTTRGTGFCIAGMVISGLLTAGGIAEIIMGQCD